MLVNSRNVAAQEISDEQHTPDPTESTDNVVNRVTPVSHLPNSGHDRHECAYDRHESRNDDGLAAVSFIELVGASEMLLVEQQRIFTREQLRAGRLADRIADGVSKDRRDGQQESEQPHIEDAGRRGEES